MKKIMSICTVLLMTSCGAIQFTPREYPIGKGSIAQLELNGKIQVTNAQPSMDQAVVYSYGGTQLVTTLKALTQSMVQQTQKELEANGTQKPGSAAKTMDLKIDSMVSKYAVFHCNSTMMFTARLGNAKVIEMKVEHTGPVAQQDINGNIADGVVQLLNDKTVKAYLAE
jgi:hypothetical protein